MKEGAIILQGMTSPEYRRIRESVAKSEVQVPRINLFPLNEEQGQVKFLSALSGYPEKYGLEPWESDNPVGMITEALQRGVFVDNFSEHLEDYAKARRPKGYFDERSSVLEKYKSSIDRWENSVIVEYPWEERGRFVRVLPEELYDATVYSRNNFIFSPQKQDALRSTRFAMDGMGVGTSIGYLLVLSGAKKFTVVDGGNITLHDHNRVPGADVRESGINHAVHWTRMAYKLNPYLDIRCYPQNLGNGENGTVSMQQFLNGADVVIEEADDLGIKIATRQAAKEQGIPVVMGTDLGKDGLLQIESSNLLDPIFNGRLTPDIMMLLQDPTIDFETKTTIAVDVMVGRDNVPSEYLDAMRRSLEANVSYWPQAAVGAYDTSRKVVLGILDLINKSSNTNS